MGRSRRRLRKEPGGEPGNATAADERLSPVFVTVPGEWDVTDAPVLPLEGLQPWDEIRGPKLLLEDPIDPLAESHSDSADPAQLLLNSAVNDEPDERDSAEFEAVAALEAITEATRADARASAIVAGLVARALAEAAPPEEAEPEIELPPPPPPPPDAVEVLYTEARAAAEEGRTTDAVARYRELLVTRPSHVGARNNLALLLDTQGDHAGALAELDRALEFDVESPTVLVNRGALLGAMGRFAAAERDLRRVLRVEPSQAEALFNLGVVMTKKGLWSEAVPLLRRSIELDPGKGPAHFHLGDALNHVDDLSSALAAYQRAAELMPNNPRALYGLGIVYDRLGRPDDAAQMYRRSREIGRR